MKIEHPELLSQDDFYKTYAEFLYIRKMDREFYLSIAKEALQVILTPQQQE